MTAIRNIKHCFDTPEIYHVFSECMYMPTWDKFTSRANEFMSNDAIHIYGHYEDERITGIIVINRNQDGSYEIKGIAVAPEYRNRGIGKKLIQYACDEFFISTLHAETDDDAVDFYKHCGFEAQEFMRTSESGEYKRYKCTLRTT